MGIAGGTVGATLHQARALLAAQLAPADATTTSPDGVTP
jgi:hypothetical protein